jgi:hypothetical protein
MTWRFFFHCRYRQTGLQNEPAIGPSCHEHGPRGPRRKSAAPKSAIVAFSYYNGGRPDPPSKEARGPTANTARYCWPDRRRRPYGAPDNMMIKSQCSRASLGLPISAAICDAIPPAPCFYERRGRISPALERYRQRVYVAALPANWRELARFQAQRPIVASRPRKANSRARQVRT